MKTTKKDFEAFKAEFLRWRDLLGLTEWRVRFHHDPLDSGVVACIIADCQARLVSVYLGLSINQPIEEAARHEALELLVADLDWLPSQRYVRREEIDAARHAVIRRLENLFDGMELSDAPKDPIDLDDRKASGSPTKRPGRRVRPARR